VLPSVRSLSNDSRLSPEDTRTLEILKRMKVMLVAKMEKVLASQSGPVSEQVDEISNSIVKVE
jgi:hypothetical protein